MVVAGLVRKVSCDETWLHTLYDFETRACLLSTQLPHMEVYWYRLVSSCVLGVSRHGEIM